MISTADWHGSPVFSDYAWGHRAGMARPASPLMHGDVGLDWSMGLLARLSASPRRPHVYAFVTLVQSIVGGIMLLPDVFSADMPSSRSGSMLSTQRSTTFKSKVPQDSSNLYSWRTMTDKETCEVELARQSA
jgi:hypothetical protein